MSREDAASDGAIPPESGRLRRPTLERSEPRRTWDNLYAPGRADAASSTAHDGVTAAPQSDASDDATRAIREGYRIVEENLRRGREAAAELRGAGREVADFAGRVDGARVVAQLSQLLIDPALTEQLAGVARGVLSALGSIIPAAPGATRAEPVREARVPLHPQERADYVTSAARVLKLRSVGPGEWLADLEIDGRVRRVQVRAVDGEL
jgi:hypothetical protein